MEHLTPTTVFLAVLAVANAIVLLSNAAEKIVKAIKAAKAPNVHQDKRLDALEEWRKELDAKLRHDLERFEELSHSERVTQRAIIALLDHGIDGNNIKQMQRAKEDLQNHLINR